MISLMVGKRLRLAVAASLAVVTVAFGGCGATQPTVTSKSTATVEVRDASPADIAGIESAFDHWELFLPTCTGVVVGGTIKVATQKASGVTWAIAKFAPAKTCVMYMLTGPGQRIKIDPETNTPGFSKDLTTTPLSIFEQPAGGAWAMNDIESQPFPCPGPGGEPPGNGNAAIPLEVLTAWGMKYAKDCSEVREVLTPGR